MPVEEDSRNTQTILGEKVGRIHERNLSIITVRGMNVSRQKPHTMKQLGAIKQSSIKMMSTLDTSTHCYPRRCKRPSGR